MGLFDKWKKNKAQSDTGGAPDFSEVDSHEKTHELFQKGQLVKLYLMPLEFGGVDNQMNILYVPAIARDLKARLDGQIEGWLREGKKLGYSASPEYKGKSFVPAKITISVTGDGELTETIHIW